MIDKKLISGLTEEKHIMKVLEEMHELGEVLTKYLNKQPEYRPKKEKIIEESGDLLYRMTLMIKKLGIEDEYGFETRLPLLSITLLVLSSNAFSASIFADSRSDALPDSVNPL